MRDITIMKKGRRLELQPATDRGTGWLLKNYDRLNPTFPAKQEKMLTRCLEEEKLTVQTVEADEGWHDYADQSSILAIASQNPDKNGALTDLGVLRRDVLHSVDPKSRTLLPEIDRQIALAHDICRFDRADKRRPAPRQGRRLSVLLWTRRNLKHVDDVLLHVAVLILFVKHMYEVLFGRVA
jgi:hypothetical protein